MAESGGDANAGVRAPAVFISYASQDAEAAERICEALRAAGVDVWFDKGVLRGGDAWDQKIRHQIRDCGLFVAVISRNTEARAEGYFRLEWHLADQRTQMMAKSRPFLVPVCIDETPEKLAEVPESFSLVHWSRLPGGETSATFVERVRRLLRRSSTPRYLPRLRRPPTQVRVIIAGSAGGRLSPAAWLCFWRECSGSRVTLVTSGAIRSPTHNFHDLRTGRVAKRQRQSRVTAERWHSSPIMTDRTTSGSPRPAAVVFAI